MAPRELVSIVMPAYAPRLPWLGDALRSALHQRGCDVEVVLVDDGSPEPVAALVEDLDDGRLRVVRIEHGGASRARNAGIEAARGDYLRFADCDDVLEPDSTARLMAAAAGGFVSHGATLVCDEALRPTGDIRRSAAEGWIAEECLTGRFSVRHMAMVFPRAVVETIGGWEPALPVCEDWDFVLRALEVAPARPDPGIAVRYRRHRGSLGSDMALVLDTAEQVVARYIDRHPEAAGTALERRARAALALARAQASGHLGVGAARRGVMLARAVALDPLRSLATIAGRGRGATGRSRGGPS